MNETPEQYTERLGRLDAIRLKGVHAEHTLRELQPLLNEMRQIYLEDLIEQTLTLGKPHELNVWRLVVLRDIIDFLGEQVGRGAAAARKLRKVTNAGGSDE